MKKKKAFLERESTRKSILIALWVAFLLTVIDAGRYLIGEALNKLGIDPFDGYILSFALAIAVILWLINKLSQRLGFET